MIATALLFSGRPNPQWRIDQATAARLAPLLAALVPAKTGDPPLPPGLGYGGIELRFEAGKGEQVLVFKDGVASGATGSFIDPGGKIEDLLADSARGHLPEAVYRTLIACR